MLLRKTLHKTHPHTPQLPHTHPPRALPCCPGSLSSGRKWHLGREWDHVFDVEMDSGAKLKLALDAGENPYIVADRFLEQHDLPQEFKEQVGGRRV